MGLTLEQAWPVPDASHVDAAVAQLVAHFDPLRVLVFGSYARGEAQHGSDLDLLVVLPEVAHKREAAIAMRRVLTGLPVPHDVYVTTPDEIERRGWIIGSLLREALDEGEVVYERSDREQRIRPMKTAHLTPIDEALIERVRDRIVAACHPQALYLFGSAARGETREGSDLDLLVVMDLPEGVRSYEMAGELSRLFDGWLVPLDILVQTPQEFEQTRHYLGHVARIASREGRLLYEREQDG